MLHQKVDTKSPFKYSLEQSFHCSDAAPNHFLFQPTPFLLSYTRELGTHLLGFFDEASLQHVLGTLRVDKAVCSVQGLSLIHPSSCFLYVAGMLQHE